MYKSLKIILFWRMKCCNEGFKFLFGRQFFDSIDKELQTLLDGSKYSQKIKAEKLQVLFDRPFSHIKEYCRLTEKLACNYDAVRNNCINLQKKNNCCEKIIFGSTSCNS